jgi:dTDP-4-amino-4,6-dideoxygalactose transaminase
MILAKDEEDIARLKVLALHGMSKDAWKRFSDDGFKHYQVVESGFKYNMMDLQAAMGIHQLRRVETCWEKTRCGMASVHESAVRFRDWTACSHRSEYPSCLSLVTVMIDEHLAGVSRDAFLNQMTSQGIGGWCALSEFARTSLLSAYLWMAS